ncbi:DUF4105 domain-containing protein [Stenotrophomonas rhizophila]|uniref:DUF7844 domain-containing protein n=1 Tax=Stenotrophomonas rhizophila TaxID=216778 RepID=UPI001E5DAD3E|nr:DUF4105 domain-containing protein [Stenotrophomonas rhizophila]MCC7633437.1 DUF4105 domain-containing protein [Stenotrophomonas rhizophila]MCC7663078.1 DUF4105 domain-containing protein [Stenotrophomonas rhizophila]
MQAPGRVRRWRWAVLAAALAAPLAQAALRFDLQPDGLDPTRRAAAERMLQEMQQQLPPAWQARFEQPVTVRWSDTLPDHVHGRAGQGAITLRRDLLDQVRPAEPVPRALQAALIHELTHVLDRSAQGGWSRSGRWRDLSGWQQRPWRLGRSANRFSQRSPDAYERSSPAEFLAVNAEHFLLDAGYACRRPALAAWFTDTIGASGLAAHCDGRLPLVQAEAVNGAASLLQLDPARVYAVDYLLAEGNDRLMSRWGHSMLRLVICAPGRAPGPACRMDLAHHRVLSFRAFVDDVQISSWRGLTGAYPSRLFVLPLNQVINEYTQVELRGLSSVPLRLAPAQIASLLERVAQVHWSYDGRYLFVSNNCAVETGKLLQEGVPGWATPGLNRITPRGLLARLQREGHADTRVLDDRALAIRQGYYFASAQDHYQQLFDVARAELPLQDVRVEDWLRRPAAQRAGYVDAAGLRTTSALLLLEQAARQREELRARDVLKRALGNSAAGTDAARDALMALLRDSGQLVSPSTLVPSGGYGLPLGSERDAAAAATAQLSAHGVPAWQQLQQQLRALLPAAQQRELATIDDSLARLGARMRALAGADAATGAAIR